MNTIIVLAMHGAPPSDFPKQELAEYFRLHAQFEHGGGMPQEKLLPRYKELEQRIRRSPRTAENDPFYMGSMDLALNLRQATNMNIMLGFNEFCAPSLDEALQAGARSGAERVIVVTPMLTRGGEHAEKDIPASIERARQEHPGIEFIYAWPFPLAEIIRFLSDHLNKFISRENGSILP
jgi:sirohydrochlorin cobaltochelatase